MRLSPRKGTKPCYACMVLPFCIMCMAFRRLGNAVPARLTKDVQILVFFCVWSHGNRFPWQLQWEETHIQVDCL